MNLSPPSNNGSNQSASNVLVQISNVEFYHVGQSLRIGRYPIFFSRAGNMTKSYVKECAVHKSFNRAFNLFETSNLTIENNFVYNIMGSAFALQSGVKTENNTFRHNLAIFVKRSGSSWNVDLSPGISFKHSNPLLINPYI